MQKRIYLDNAATTCLDNRLLEVILPLFNEQLVIRQAFILSASKQKMYWIGRTSNWLASLALCG